ncbi:TetR/AcrR family transcriptional regulator C-terminal domain-containing protein [Aeromicrobium sp. UC242_57]|uniref:TetR/AcrR family transcriptional regulator C-terminal domain-containing protein n=1 Tax=Aeromicrobium sp. UC242_57 TaxID=3374624 RepID=UPI00379E9E42
MAAVADEVLERGTRAARPDQAWDEQVGSLSRELRDAMLAYRDGAELVATVHAFGLGSRSPSTRLATAIESAGFDEAFAQTAAMTVLHFTFGHVSDEQTQLQANSVGAIDADPLTPSGAESFDLGLGLILDGIRQRQQVEVSR